MIWYSFLKCYTNICNLNIMDFVSFCSCIKPLGNDHLTLNVSFGRTDTLKNSFFIRICRLWNDLLLKIRELTPLMVFSRYLTSF